MLRSAAAAGAGAAAAAAAGGGGGVGGGGRVGRVVVVGGVAGGATAAARARRVSEAARITVFERGPFVSFANCGLPYYVKGEIAKRDQLLLSSPEVFRAKYDIDVRVNHEVVAIDRARRVVRVRTVAGGNAATAGGDEEAEAEFEEPYDALVLAPGAAALRPASLRGSDASNVFVLKTVPDAAAIRAVVDSGRASRAVVVGGGAIGLETAEAFVQRGCSNVTLIEAADHILPPFDGDMAQYVEHHLLASGVELELGARVASFDVEEGTGDGEDGVGDATGKKRATGVRLSDGRVIPCDIVVLSLGVRGEVQLANEAGLELGKLRGMRVDDCMRSVTDSRIFCVGDAVEVPSRVTGKPGRFMLAGPAQKQARVAGTHAALLADAAAAAAADGGSETSELKLADHPLRYRGALGTSIVGVLGCVAGSVGLNEAQCQAEGIAYRTALTHPLSHVSYVPGSEFMHIKLIVTADETARILGAQVVGVENGGVARRVDVLATALAGNLTAEDLEGLDLAYSPHHGAAQDPVAVAGFVAAAEARHEVNGLSPDEYVSAFLEEKKEHVLLDVRPPEEFALRSIANAINIPLTELRERAAAELPNDGTPIITTCRVGLTAYVAARMLSNKGFPDVRLLKGGITSAHARMHPDDATFPPHHSHAHHHHPPASDNP